ncbi:MAG TPA: dienelactone hydrolase family protein, partial [Vicinamibacteria bacterium]|nr:dienelactone hydrolase family protein [Vicinamibacteria bacterium]
GPDPAREPLEGQASTGWLAMPEPGRDKGIGVVVIQEYWGLVGHIKSVSDRFAQEGFTALAPDLYHGQEARSPDEAGKMLMALDVTRAERDLSASVEHLMNLTGKKVGVVGFCMGGALSLFAACVNGERVGACVVYYGGHPKIDYDFDRLQAPVLGHWAENDDWANASQTRFAEAFARYGKAYEFHTYPGTRHAFFNDERPQVYAAEAARLSWTRTIAFFDRHL